MAKQEDLARIRQGVKAWNDWMEETSRVAEEEMEALFQQEIENWSDPDFDASRDWTSNIDAIDPSDLSLEDTIYVADLSGAELTDLKLDGVMLWGTYLAGANLSGSSLKYAELRGSDLTKANLTDVNIAGADLTNALLRETKLRGADLTSTKIQAADLEGADFEGAYLYQTIFSDVDLSKSKNLDAVKNGGPSTIGIDTIYRSRAEIPESFLKKAGIPDSFMSLLREIKDSPKKYLDCFISYAEANDGFASKLRADLDSASVRVYRWREAAFYSKPE